MEPDLAEARRRAAALAAPGDAEGLRDLQRLMSAAGLPAVRALFLGMLRASPQRPAKLAAIRAELEAMRIPAGCMKVDFFNVETRRADKVFLVLDGCPRGHDPGPALDGLRRLVPPEKWPEILRSLSALLFYGRNVYAQFARDHVGWLKKIFRRDDPCDDLLNLQVDFATSTLFVLPDWPTRIGFYILREEDEPHQADASAAPASTLVGPSSVGPSSVGPSSVGPSSAEPASVEPASVEPASAEPASVEPASVEREPSEPASAVREASEPASGGPPSGGPPSGGPPSGATDGAPP